MLHVFSINRVKVEKKKSDTHLKRRLIVDGGSRTLQLASGPPYIHTAYRHAEILFIYVPTGIIQSTTFKNREWD